MAKPLYVYYHTHWDREWYLPFRAYQHRLLKVVDDVLEATESGTLPCFTLDGQTVLLEDYLEFRPENRTRLETLVQSEKISIGPWYVMPDEFLVSGESLIRNLERGIEISRAYGEKTFTGYLPDTFGHSADIPMILKHFGIDSAIVWRGVSPEQPFFLWESPSGDSVLTTHLTEGYFQNVFHMGKDQAEKDQFFNTWLSKVAELTPENEPMLFPVGADHLGIVSEAPKLMHQLAPDAKPITPDTYMHMAGSIEPALLQTFTGELRDCSGSYILPGVYSSRLYLKQWNRRMEWRLTRQLEPLLTWQKQLGQMPHCQAELAFLWKTLLLNHPHDSICGCSVDSVHRENEVRFEQIDQLSEAMVRDAHHALRQALQSDGAIMLLNHGDAPYTGVVEIQADYPLNQPTPEVFPEGQVLSEETLLDESFLLNTSILPLSENKALRRKTLVWAKDVPAHGIKLLTKPETATDMVLVSPAFLENYALRVQVTLTGELIIEDLLSGAQYKGMHQLWQSAEQGDSYNAAPLKEGQPEQAEFIESQVIHHGPLRGTLHLAFRFPSNHLAVDTLVSLDAGSTRLDFETRFTNRTPDQKIQAVFHTRSPIEAVLAEGHFSPVTRTYDPAYRIQDHMPAARLKELPVHSGPIQRFVTVQEQTLITEGLTEYEVEANQLKITLLRAFGMLSRDDTGVRGSHAGPPLETPEGQCLNRPFIGRYAWQSGNDLTQSYAQSDWFYGAITGFDRLTEANASVKTPPKSFYTWDNPNVISTACIPVEDGYLLRLMNPTGETQPVALELPKSSGQPQRVDLNGEVLETLAGHKTSIPPYHFQTLKIPVL